MGFFFFTRQKQKLITKAANESLVLFIVNFASQSIDFFKLMDRLYQDERQGECDTEAQFLKPIEISRRLCRRLNSFQPRFLVLFS